MENALTAASPRRRSHSSRRRVAVADALAGVVGSLVSLWVFYPMEVYKTQVQAAPSTSTVVSSSSAAQKEKQKQQQKTISCRLLETLAAGWKWKTLHTASSSFCYFFLYSWIISLWTTSSILRKRQDSNNGTTTRQISTSARLVLSATAAMLNTCLTLPLDVVAARQQNEKQQQLENSVSSTLWRIQEENYYDAKDEESDQEEEEKQEKEEDFCQEEKKEDIIFEWKSANKHEVSIIRSASPKESNLSYILSLWKGLGPSLLLCTNPAIHYTCFDTIKSRILLHRQSSSSNSNSNNNNNSLTMGEAFFLGILAKFVATIVTYPLIRTKVMLMVAATSPPSPPRGRRRRPTSTTTSMLQCLNDEYKANGMRGLYQGCNLQLLHTLLKSALLMMIRERLTRTTSRLILGNNNSTTTATANSSSQGS